MNNLPPKLDCETSPEGSSEAVPKASIEQKTLRAQSLQADFFKRMGCSQQFRMLFEYLPDVHFFAKDVNGHFVAASRGVVTYLGFSSEADMIGLTDLDIHPERVVREIRADDRTVMETRMPITDRIEALYTRTNAKEWYMTTKMPILDTEGEVIGVMGIVRPYSGRGGLSVHGIRISEAVAYIQAEHRNPIGIPELAKMAHLSTRQLNRHFQNVFGMSAQEFIVRTRVQAASEDLLNTDKTLSQIASEHGFYDQSAFARHFKNHTGENPLKFRQRRRKIDLSTET